MRPSASKRRPGSNLWDLVGEAASISFIYGSQLPSGLQEWRRHYDLVVINSPPVLGMTDTRFLAPLADAVVFVTRWVPRRFPRASRVKAA